MLNIYKNVISLDRKRGVNKPIEDVLCQRRIQNFLRVGVIKVWHLFKRSFSGKADLKQIEEQKRF